MSSISQLIRPDLQYFKPYSSARDEAQGGKIWLNANELPWGQNIIDNVAINRYPEKQPPALLKKISAIYQVKPDQLGLFRGSDEPIDLLVRLFCRAEQDAIMVFPPTFGMYTVCAQLQGAKIIAIPLRKDQDFQLDISAILSQWTPAVKILFICSPNNPTGNSIRQDDIATLCQTFAGKSIIVVDEAYVEFSAQASCSHYINQFDNLAILRTFSKAYGLAGARFGALLAQHELIQWLCAIMAPYPLPAPTVNAIEKVLAPAQLEQIQQQVACIKQERTRLFAALATLPFVKKIWPSDGNFLLIEADHAAQIMSYCMQQGIVLRSMQGRPELPQGIRISIGTPEENDQLLAVLRQFILVN